MKLATGNTLELDSNLALVFAQSGEPVEPGTKVYANARGNLGRFVRVGPERGDLGGIVIWFDDPKSSELKDGQLRAA